MAMPDPRVVIVNGDQGDWQGLYIDGSLADEGHSLGLKATLEMVCAAGIGPNDIIERSAIVDRSLPDNLSDVEWMD